MTGERGEGALAGDGRARLAIAAAALALAASTSLSGVLEPFELVASDAVLRAASRRVEVEAFPAEVPDAAVVGIDPRSIHLWAWPWSRALHARLVDALEDAGARAVVFDIDFAPARDAEGDALFARAIERSGRVVLASIDQVGESADAPDGEAAGGATRLPLASLARPAAAIGSAMLPIDADGVIRRVPLPSVPSAPSSAREPADSRDAGADALPPLALAALWAVRPDARPALDTALRIDHRGRWTPMPVVSAVDVLEGRFDARELRDRVVFVGATAPLLQDMWTTPLDALEPGVVVQARIYRSLAASAAGVDVLRVASVGVRLGVLAAIALVASLATSFAGGARRAALVALGAAGCAGAVAAAVALGLLVDVVAPLLLVGVLYVLDLEQVRRVFGERVEAQDQSLGALVHVGEVAAGSGGEPSLEVALGLLADVVDASGVALLRASRAGGLDGRRIEWRRRTNEGIGSDAEAARALAAGATRTCVDASRGRAVYVPLRARERVLGVLVVEREQQSPLDALAMRTIGSVASQLSLTAENLNLIDDLRRMAEATIVSLATAIESRDGYTEMHCRRLSVLSGVVAERLGLGAKETRDVRLGAMLHDVGKIGIPDALLLKRGRFTPEEREQMQSHAEVGHRIVAPIHGLEPETLACVRHHHERWDGGGYPLGLECEAIPLGARIVTVVDVWDALSSERPYKPAYPADKVRAILEKGRGTEFDPAVLDVFLRVLDDEGEELLAMLEGPIAITDFV
ncbi:MAG: CHASE2 domain-containing protein [Myxococcota bacterium]